LEDAGHNYNQIKPITMDKKILVKVVAKVCQHECCMHATKA